MKVECEVEEVEVDGDYSPVDGLCVTCSRCHHSVEVGGRHGRSLRKAYVKLREECPEGGDNFYTSDHVAEGS